MFRVTVTPYREVESLVLTEGDVIDIIENAVLALELNLNPDDGELTIERINEEEE
jgi:hypothetical protein